MITFTFPFSVSSNAVTFQASDIPCGCAFAEPDRPTYQPGERGVFTVRMLVEDRVGTQEVEVIAKTGDPAKPEQVLALTAIIPELLRFDRKIAIWDKASGQAFQESILDYQVVGIATAAALAWWLPWFEIICALSLWWPRFRLAGLTGITLMVVGFLVILASALARGLGISCGCFGAAGHGLWVALAIDAVLLVACLAAWILMLKPADRRRSR